MIEQGNGATGGSLDFVSIVYLEEVEMLRLQARSMEKFLEPEAVGGILIIINDYRGEKTAQAVRDMLPCYGKLAPRVRVIQAGDMFGPGKTRWHRLEQWYLRYIQAPLRIQQSGWAHTRGWRTQQALKLLAARHCTAPQIVILDAKNVLLEPVGRSDLLGATGKPLTALRPFGEKTGRWLQASFRVFGRDKPPQLQVAPPNITPQVFSRAFVLDALEAISERVGPLEVFFNMRSGGATEFMLLYAYAEVLGGGFMTYFDEGLPAPASVFQSFDAEATLKQLDKAAQPGRKFAGIHRTFYLKNSDEVLLVWKRLLMERGILRSEAEWHRLVAGARGGS